MHNKRYNKYNKYHKKIRILIIYQYMNRKDIFVEFINLFLFIEYILF
jgi:hypothetical protein